MSSLAYAIGDTAVVAKRNLLRIPRQPDLWVSFTIQPLMFVLLFVYVFGGAIQTPGFDNYMDFLMPGIIFQTMAFGGFVTAIGLSDDLTQGPDRPLPFAPHGPLGSARGPDARGRGTNMVSLAVMVVVGLLVGFNFSSSPLEVVAGFGLVLLFGYAFSWVFAYVALVSGSRGGRERARLHRDLPAHVRLVRVRADRVDARRDPGVRGGEPVQHDGRRHRALFVGTPAGNNVWGAVAWCVGLIAVFGVLAVYKYRRAVSA